MSIRIASFSRIALLACAALFASSSVQANNPPEANKPALKKKVGKKPAVKTPAALPDEETPDTNDAASTDFQCELGAKLTIYNHAKDEQHVALRWKNRLLQLTRVSTSTGADRYENTRQGLVWIGIPSKGMLLDAKKGQQLANECRSAEQIRAQAEAALELSKPVAKVEVVKEVAKETIKEAAKTEVKPEPAKIEAKAEAVKG